MGNQKSYTDIIRTDNTVTKEERRKGETMIYKTLQRKQKIEQQELHKKR